MGTNINHSTFLIIVRDFFVCLYFQPNVIEFCCDSFLFDIKRKKFIKTRTKNQIRKQS